MASTPFFMRKITMCGLLAVFVPCAAHPAISELSSDAIVARSKPAVFKIVTSLEASFSYSAGAVEFIHVKSDAERREIDEGLGNCTPAYTVAELELVRSQRGPLNCADRSDFFWSHVIKYPSAYLESERTNFLLAGGGWFPQTASYTGRFASGTGFAISSDGILLTAAHVVSAPSGIEAMQVFANGTDVLDQLLRHLEESGHVGAPGPELIDAVVSMLLKRIYLKVKNMRVSQIEVFSAPNLDQSLGIQHGSLGESGVAARYLPAKILAIGVPDTIEDIAVLSVPALKGAVVTLPLGDSREYHNPVHAMGFPGTSKYLKIAEDPVNVIVHNGEVQDVRIGNENWLRLTAAIFHGDSGGPVVDATGNVIGINEAGLDVGQPFGTSENVAIPINASKKYIKEARVSLDPGPITEHWIAGQDAFQSQLYYRARWEFSQIIHLGNPFILQAYRESERLAGTSEDKSSWLDKVRYHK